MEQEPERRKSFVVAEREMETDEKGFFMTTSHTRARASHLWFFK